MEELIERFEKETGFKFYTVIIDKCDDLYCYEFVEWLVKQLSIPRVINSNVKK